MRRMQLVVLAIAAALLLSACGGKGDAKAGKSAKPARGEATVATGTSGMPGDVEQPPAIAGKDVAEDLGVQLVFQAAVVEESEAGLEAVATAQLAEGEKASERQVFALLASLAEEAPRAAFARVEIWTPGTPDSRFAQYLWDRELARLERFEASVPAEEYAHYTPSGAASNDAEAEGFDASRTGVIDAVDLAALKALSSGTPKWQSDTP